MNRQRTWYLVLSLTFCLPLPIALLWVSGATARALAGTARYVGPTGTDSGARTNPGTPCRSVQYAVDQADGGDEILTAGGVYTGVQARAGISQVVYKGRIILAFARPVKLTCARFEV